MAVNHQKMLARAIGHYQADRAADADAACVALLARWPHDVDALNLRAVIACRAGRFADGVILLERLLKRHPDNVTALTSLGDAHNALGDRAGEIMAFECAVRLAPRDAALCSKLGTALLQNGRAAEAVAAYEQSIALAGGIAQAHFNHGVALSRLNRTTEAAGAYRHAIRLDSHHSAAHLNLGNLLMDDGAHDDAIALYRTAIALRPDSAEAHSNLGLALLQQHRFDDAAACQLQAIACDPCYAVAHAALGAVRREQREPDEAVQACELAIALQPDLAEAYVTLGAARLDLYQPDEAIACYRRALELTPDDARIHCNLGVALIRIGRIDEAAECCRKGIALNPLHAPAHTNLGVALQRQDRVDDAIAAHRMAIALDPAFPKAWSNLSEGLKEQGRLDEALQASRTAVSFAACEPIQRFNYALALLMEGDYAAGWPAFESRREAGVLTPRARRFAVPEWRGESLFGKTLLLHAEQGLGDTLQFVRFVHRLLAPGVAIVIECQKPLVSLLRASFGVRVMAQGEPLPPYDLHLPLMSLPNVLRIGLDAVPAAPYLAADPDKAAAWQTRIGRSTELAVGVVWSGNPDHKSDARRSLAAARVLTSLAMPGVGLFSLQKQVRSTDRPAFRALGGTVTDLAPWLSDFTDTAAALQSLDVVIAVDTSVAHLAGALGRPVWMITPYALDWRWLRDREDSPWYPTMRLFRQSAPRAWDDVLARIRTDLVKLVGERIAAPPGRAAVAQARHPEATF